MWEVYEHNSLVRKLRGIPVGVLKRYEKWKDIVTISGPKGLRLIKGFHDEALKGEWQDFRSSRLGKQYRLIYRIEDKKLYVKEMDITPHDYRRK
ncbi:MAG: type II toxin-antitoxin system mRNA interferase toxin, RelE/StbE family [Verrucomicrobiae bacterium]|nr:type II toxin-antitoxin system mRNA interferase toxin, RelE/StbE family [Verrucomicrobiae bacterium]